MQRTLTQGVGGGVAVHMAPVLTPADAERLAARAVKDLEARAKLPPEVRVIPASKGAPLQFGALGKLAERVGICIELGGDAGGPEREGWKGYVASGPLIGELPDAYESAEECAQAALTALRDKIDAVL